jgi:hypothetical protein
MQVNLPWKAQTDIASALQAHSSCVAIAARPVEDPEQDKAPIARQLEDGCDMLVTSLSAAYSEIVKLMARSSWPRFVTSNLYPEVRMYHSITHHCCKLPFTVSRDEEWRSKASRQSCIDGRSFRR